MGEFLSVRANQIPTLRRGAPPRITR